MPQSIEETFRPLLDAVAFAARAHRGQTRKDGETPYASHVFRVCLVLAHVFGVRDQRVLTAAVLHDTLEDTTTDFDDLAERWDAEIATWAAMLSKDKRLPEEEREDAYCTTLSGAPWQVQVCKLADMFDNTLDMGQLPPGRRPHTIQRLRRYLEALRSNLKPEAVAAYATVARLLEETERGTAAPPDN
jgi:guanosine-3',5'-bis(diphosphate) 3'-pyrophosphohydrolase